MGSVNLPSGSDIVGSAVDARGLLYLTDAATRTLTVYGPVLPYGPIPVAVPTVGHYIFPTVPGGVLAGPNGQHVWVGTRNQSTVYGIAVDLDSGLVSVACNLTLAGSGVLGSNPPFMIVTQGTGDVSSHLLVVVTYASLTSTSYGEVWDVTAPAAPQRRSQFTPDHAGPAAMASYGGDGYFYLSFSSGFLSECVLPCVCCVLQVRP